MDELTFGQRLVYYRTRKKMLQKELAKKAGVSPTALNYYEKDKREPNVLTIIALADALGVTGDELLGISTYNSPTQAQGEDEISLLKNYRLLNKQGKDFVRQALSVSLNTYVVDDSFEAERKEYIEKYALPFAAAGGDTSNLEDAQRLYDEARKQQKDNGYD